MALTYQRKDIGSGGDYTTIAAWHTAEVAPLVSLDQIRIGQLLSQTHNTGKVVISGWSSDATRFPVLMAKAGAEYDPITDTGAKVFQNVTGTATLDCDQDYTRFGTDPETDTPRGFMMDINVNELYPVSLDCADANYTHTDALVFRYTYGSATARIAMYNTGNGDNNVLRNSIFIGMAGAHATNIASRCVLSFNGANPFTIDNCVCYEMRGSGGNGRGFDCGNSTTATNCIAMESGSSGYDFKSSCNGSYNISSDTSAPDDVGSTSYTNQTDTDIFNDPTNDDFRVKTTGNAYNNGDDLSTSHGSTFDWDLEGNTRSGSWEIGAYDESALAVAAQGMDSVLAHLVRRHADSYRVRT